MKIVKLAAENVKKIRAIMIEFKDNYTIISGKNGQGKSSAIDCIEYALCGKESLPDKVIREGEDFAKIVLETDQYIISRHWTSNEKSYLKVTTLDGAQYPSPQTMLNKLVGGLSFDPVGFIKDKDQVGTLKKLVGLNFSNIDMQIAENMESRKLAGRERDRLKMIFNELPVYESFATLPDEEIFIAEILAEKNKAENQLKANDMVRKQLKDMQDEYHEREQLIKYKIQKKAELLKEIETINREIEEEEKKQQLTTDTGKSLKTKVAALTDPDLSDYDRQLMESEETNRLIRAKINKSAIENSLGDKVVEYDQFTEKIENLKQQKLDLLATTKFPVPGLSFQDEIVTYNGIPLSQCSQAEQIKVGFAIAMALNPELKVITVKDASLLDESNLKIIRDMAIEKDYLVILERVEEEEGSIIIEEGEIKCQQQS